jgi:transcriptional regulator with XRE-family HTH domain
VFIASRFAGCCDFATFYDALDVPTRGKLEAVARYLDVSPRTVSAWLNGTREPPAAAVRALMLESHFGRQAIACAAENDARTYYGLARALQSELDEANRRIEALRVENAALKRAHLPPKVAANDAA